MLIYPYQIDPNYVQDTPREYLNEFFKQNTLIFTEHTINHTETELVNLFKNAGPVDQIIIDITHNSYDLTNPNLTNGYNILSKLANTIILADDFSLFYQPQKNFIFFPVFFWGFSNRSGAWYTQVTFDCKSLNKTNLLCCFNKSPWWHRIYLFCALVEKSWFKKISYTFGTHAKYYDRFIDALADDEKDQFNKFKKLLPIVINESDLESQPDIGISHSAYADCVVNLITENTTDIGFITEKTCKPFMAHQIPILIGATNISQFCEDIGFDMFSDIVPWKSWDGIDDVKERITAIVNFLDNFINEDPVELYAKCQSRLETNKQYFHSTEFRNILLKQLNEFVFNNIL